MSTRPHFIIIGAMKCATSSLHEQLASHPGIFMTQLKEPNFFSDDDQYAKGMTWYQSYFADASPTDLCGESSTHYTKLPTYPHTIQRLKEHVPSAKFIYVMRHPIDRLVSHYIHEWTQCVISTDIHQALQQHPELVSYSQYSQQLKPYLDTFGFDRVLPVFFERLCQYPQQELERVCQFIGYPEPPTWKEDLGTKNASSERLRKNAIRDFFVDAPILSDIRRNLIPRSWRDWVKGWWMMKKRPELSPEEVEELQAVFDEDLKILGSWLGTEQLSCDNFKSIVREAPHEWVKVSL
ncbi:MAG: sulfotransferase [Elainellaceae cyanobacterium]